MPDRSDILEEHIRMTTLRLLVDRTAYRLRWTPLDRQEAIELIEETRDEVLELFPDKGEVFELVLRPRFMRFLDERALVEWGLADAMN